MNKWIKRATAVGLCTVLCVGTTCTVYAKTYKKDDMQTAQAIQKDDGQIDDMQITKVIQKDETQAVQTLQKGAQASQKEGIKAVQTAAVTTKTSDKKENTQPLSKDETVYVLAGSDGSVQKVIVSDWIKNMAEYAEILDVTELSDIENVKGDEGYTSGTDNSKIWDAKGNDIYYQGNTEKELPVALKITYQLDGKNITAEELAGKSGKVTIRFDYENKQYELVRLDRKDEKIYVPFAMLTGMVLDNDCFRNVEVVNGRLLNDGERSIVAGIAFPGLQKSLGIDEDVLMIPDYVEITADVTDFSMGMTITLGTNEIFSALDVGSADELTASMEELQDAMQQLMDGSSELYDGLSELLKKTDALVNGVNELTSGAEKLKTGAASLDAGAAELKNGIGELSGGLSTLSANSAGLNNGAAQVFQTLLATATSQLQAAGISVPTLTIENYADVLNGLLDSLKEAAAQAQQAAQGAGEMQAQGAGEAQAQQSTVGAAEQLAAAIETITALKGSLDSYNSFYQGLRSYTGGVDSASGGAARLSGGANSLKSGTEELSAGASSLYDGSVKLQSSMPALVEGITKVRNGSKELSDGLQAFNEQGIQKLVDLVEGDLDGIADRMKATVEVSKAYQSFAGISEEMTGQVRFIYRTDEN